MSVTVECRVTARDVDISFAVATGETTALLGETGRARAPCYRWWRDSFGPTTALSPSMTSC